MQNSKKWFALQLQIERKGTIPKRTSTACCRLLSAPAKTDARVSRSESGKMAIKASTWESSPTGGEAVRTDTSDASLVSAIIQQNKSPNKLNTLTILDTFLRTCSIDLCMHLVFSLMNKAVMFP